MLCERVLVPIVWRISSREAISINYIITVSIYYTVITSTQTRDTTSFGGRTRSSKFPVTYKRWGPNHESRADDQHSHRVYTLSREIQKMTSPRTNGFRDRISGREIWMCRERRPVRSLHEIERPKTALETRALSQRNVYHRTGN